MSRMFIYGHKLPSRAQCVHQLCHLPTTAPEPLHTFTHRPAQGKTEAANNSLTSPQSFLQEKQIVISDPSLLFPLLLSGLRECCLLANYWPLTVQTAPPSQSTQLRLNGPCYNQRRNLWNVLAPTRPLTFSWWSFPYFLYKDKHIRKNRTYTQNLYPIAYGKLDQDLSKVNKLYRFGCFWFYYQLCLWASVLFESCTTFADNGLPSSCLAEYMIPLSKWWDVW